MPSTPVNKSQWTGLSAVLGISWSAAEFSQNPVERFASDQSVIKTLFALSLLMLRSHILFEQPEMI